MDSINAASHSDLVRARTPGYAVPELTAPLLPEDVQASVADRLTQAGFWEELPSRWVGGEAVKLMCCQTRQETHDVKSFFFYDPSGCGFSFEPGQFITLSVNVAGNKVSRCYTISSPPTRPHTISITVKRAPGGVVSNWLHDNLHAGDLIEVFGPAGSFTAATYPAKKSLYLSAGSGITPLMSMARTAYELGLDSDIVFLHSARTPLDLIFRPELELMQTAMPGFRLVYICDQPDGNATWNGLTGRLSPQVLRQAVPDFLEREVFVCGPAGYMASIRSMLEDAQYDMQHYHQESFEIETLTTENENLLFKKNSDPKPVSPDSTTYSVYFARSNKTVTMTSLETLLSAAKKAGIVAPSSCRQGMCGTCKVRLVQGTVEMHHNGGIRQREIDKGDRLMCCSRPTSDLMIEL